ncbi:cyclopropane-fatty-acyl-phospholipid synthase family protein [Neptuniibacter sp. CAU 1671]|uniref:SAM-dependent methyltransferase n=1 Tax=Neptuniibacter sp. CAU 1671 TaxID=3032593 RepID=UPI0023DC159A|nr:cyclopropane-fatty-acyl-phospholipid synthase family protein [Neptuniibacter sp. CAU 1671]MDF2182802.1 cyclopropane-fatty-acyl-phospholipid synthase [Neptuniibacter sp. CAU 1671]
MKPSEYHSPEQTLKLPKMAWNEQLFIRYLNHLFKDKQGQLDLTLPSGSRTLIGQGSPSAQVTLNSWKALTGLLFGGINGWSDRYLDGDWESDNLTQLVEWALHQEQALEKMAWADFVIGHKYNRIHRKNHNSRDGSRRNIAAHYDLGNDFYKRWLDPSMTYSSALYSNHNESLEAAQTNKYNKILEMLAANRGEQILEIGCGWGSFATQAANQGLRVHGVSLSNEQLARGNEQVSKKGLSEQIELTHTDYRDLTGQYDHIVSIEMFEAVGEEHWDHYFQILRERLKPGGRAVLQIISIEDQRYHVYKKQADFIQRYIFPGGMLPSVSVLKQKFQAHGFLLKEQLMFGKDYAKTLKIWREQFEHAWKEIATLGFDERFYRMWRYYLAYCEGGFNHGALDVGLYQLELAPVHEEP